MGSKEKAQALLDKIQSYMNDEAGWKVAKKSVSWLDNYQTTEVSDMQWLTWEECQLKFRPYNPEKSELINNINKVLNKYSLIS